MKAVREMLDDEDNKLTLAAFFEYCSRIDATVMVRAAGTWAKRELKRANERIDYFLAYFRGNRQLLILANLNPKKRMCQFPEFG